MLRRDLRKKMAKVPEALALLVFCLAMLSPGTASGDWLQFNGDPQHSGNNVSEMVIKKDNVARLAKIFQVTLPGVVDGCPVALNSVQTKQGLRDLVFVTTRSGYLIAMDGSTGQGVWMSQHAAGNCRINKGHSPCITTASPAIDPNLHFIYTYGLDGYVHKHAVADGTEITGRVWPELTTLKPYDEKGSSSLTIATDESGRTFLYAVHSGYNGDKGNYQGHVTTIELANGRQEVFNAVCSNITVHLDNGKGEPSCTARQAGIWGRAGVVYVKGLDRVFTTTGNGPFDPYMHHWGDTVLALNPDGTGRDGGPLDSFTPAEHLRLQKLDKDLGSAGPALLPAPANCKVTYPGLQAGKDKLLRLLNLEDLSGQKRPGNTGGELGRPIPVPQGGEVLTAPAVWSNPADRSGWVFVANGKGLSAFTVRADKKGMPYLRLQWVNRIGGTSPLIAGNILYYASSRSIRALDPISGKQLWSSNSIGRIHWQSPIVSNGVLYITDEDGRITGFSPSPSIGGR